MSLVDIRTLSADDITALLDRADAMAAGDVPQFPNAIICCAFFEPSTRTRLSFETAAHRMGAQVIGFSDAKATSSSKGESLEDTMRVLAGYADVLVMRHPETGSAARAKACSDIPVVNAGDGAGQHPTQTLLDLYTMRTHGPLKGLKVAVLGDLKYGRTVHSLVPALRVMGAEVRAVPSPGLEFPAGYDVPSITLEQAIATSDVLYSTRVQRERFDDDGAFAQAEAAVRLDADRLANYDGIVMHPLPRQAELDASVDALPSAKYFEQAKNGVVVRMAVLASLLETVS